MAGLGCPLGEPGHLAVEILPLFWGGGRRMEPERLTWSGEEGLR